MKQTLRFGRQRCERYTDVIVWTYSWNAKAYKSTKRVGVRIFS